MLMTRYCARIVLLGALAIMLFPYQRLGGINLELRAVEGSGFGVCMVLLVLARAEQLRRLHHLNAGTLISCLPSAALELIVIAGMAEAGQSLVHRHAAFGHFLSNAAIIVAVAATCAAFLAMASHQRLAKRIFDD